MSRKPSLTLPERAKECIAVTVPGLVLASASPRRRELLAEAGFEFTVDPASIPEHVLPGEEPEAATCRLACEKARTVARRASRGVIVLAADTSVIVDREMLGKPVDRDDAVSMLLRLSGRNHRVVTAWAALSVGEDASAVSGATVSVVRMREIGLRDALVYASTDEPHDKAGAYAAQGEGRRFIAAVLGPLDNVIGIPLAPVTAALEYLGVRPMRR